MYLGLELRLEINNRKKKKNVEYFIQETLKLASDHT